MLFSPQLLARKRPTVITTGLDSSTTTWINAVVADGGSVSATQQTRVDNLIKGLKTDSLFTIIDRIWLFGGESETHQAKIDIINLVTNTANGSIALSAAGYLSNGLTGYIDTGFVPNAGGHQYVQDSAAIGAYIQTGASDSGVAIGANSGGTLYSYIQQVGTFAAELNAGNFPNFSITTNGDWSIVRAAAGSVTTYRNGGSATNISDASGGLGSQSIFVCAQNNLGIAANFCSSKISAAWIGSGLNATQITNLAGRLNTYMTAWGINVY